MTDSGIEIAGDSPRYWSYNGDPTLLLGEPSQDNLFRVPGVEHQLDVIANAGGKIHCPERARTTWWIHRLSVG